jgi:hypothetical protein
MERSRNGLHRVGGWGEPDFVGKKRGKDREQGIGNREKICAHWRLDGSHLGLRFPTGSIVRVEKEIMCKPTVAVLPAVESAAFGRLWGRRIPGSRTGPTGRRGDVDSVPWARLRSGLGYFRLLPPGRWRSGAQEETGVDREVHATAGQEAGATASCTAGLQRQWGLKWRSGRFPQKIISHKPQMCVFCD